MNGTERIESLREEFRALRAGGESPDDQCRVDYTVSDAGIHVFFYGSFYDEAFAALADAISSEDMAAELCELVIDGPDEGANGTRNVDLSELFHGVANCPELRRLEVKRSQPSDHNQTVIAETYEEDRQIGDFVARAPRLETLIVPSAPEQRFFETAPESLRHLDIDAGYDTQNFIARLTTSSVLKNLQALAWGEYAQTYLEDWINHVTPYEHMEKLFRASAFEGLSHFVLRNPTYSDEELHQLSALRPSLQFMVVRETSRYVPG